MDELASLIAITMNAGTPLLLAALGIVINERSGVVNLGTEGMMLVAAVVGFATTLFTGQYWLGFVAGAAAGIVMALLFAAACGRLVDQSICHRPGFVAVRRGAVGVHRACVARRYVAGARRRWRADTARCSVFRSGVVRAALARLLLACARGGGRVVSVSNPRRLDPARGRRIAGIARMRWVIRCGAFAVRRWRSAAPARGWPARTCRRSTRRCGPKEWSRGAAGLHLRW